MADERRAPIQGEGSYQSRRERWTEKTRPPGTISWEEHVEVWNAYAAQHGRGQSAERIAERGGFGYYEAAGYLGHPLTTWREGT